MMMMIVAVVILAHLAASTASSLPVPSSMYPSLQSAIDAAAFGDTIQLASGSFSGNGFCNVAINVQRDINIVGKSTTIDCLGLTRCLSIMGSTGRITVSGMQFKNCQAPGTPPELTNFRSKTNDIGGRLLPRSRASRERKFLVSIKVVKTFITSDGQVIVQSREKMSVPSPKGGQQRKLLQVGATNTTNTVINTTNSLINTTTMPSLTAVTNSTTPSNISTIPITTATIPTTTTTKPITTTIPITTTTSSSYGGGILISNCSNSIYLSNVMVAGSRASIGAGIAVINSSSVIFNNVTCVGNGVHTDLINARLSGAGAYIFNSKITVVDSTFVGNFFGSKGKGSTVYGGGLYLEKCSSAVLSGLISISNNVLLVKTPTPTSSLLGAGFFAQSCDYLTISADLFYVSQNSISGNGASSVLGAGFYMAGCSNAVISSNDAVFDSNSIVVSGTTTAYGAGASITGCSNVIMNASTTFSNNAITGARTVFGAGMSVQSTNVFLISGWATFQSNSITTQGQGNHYGGGLIFSSCNAVSLNGSLYFLNNSISTVVSSNTKGFRHGAGFTMLNTNDITIVGPLECSYNSLYGENTGNHWGVGMSFKSCQNVVMVGPITAIGNTGYLTSLSSLNGGAISLLSCNNVTTIGPIYVLQSMLSRDINGGSLSGGGIFAQDTHFWNVLGDVVISGNTLSSPNEVAIDSAYDNAVSGAGLYVQSSSNITWFGSLSVINNVGSIFATSSSNAFGGGIVFYGCSSLDFDGDLLVFGNSLIGSMAPMSGGLAISASCERVRILGRILVNNNTVSGGYYANFASGIGIGSSSQVLISGTIDCSFNTITASDYYQASYGGCLWITDSSAVTFAGPMRFEFNSISQNGSSLSRGGAAYIATSNDISLIGPAIFKANSIYSGFVPFEGADANYQNISNIAECVSGSLVVVKSTYGLISNGPDSRTNYKDSLHCCWQITLDPTDAAFSILEFNFTLMDVESFVDGVTLRDGPDQFSTIIGDYSGTLDNLHCVGPCPSPIRTTNGVAFVEFNSNNENGNGNYRGFVLGWTTLPDLKTSGNQGIILESIGGYPQVAAGGAISLLQSSLNIANVTFESNLVVSTIFAAGGAIFAEEQSSINIVDQCIFVGNAAVATIAAGGAIAIHSSSSLMLSSSSLLLSSSFYDNSAIANGAACFYIIIGNQVLCPASYGGAILAAAASTMNVESLLLSANAVACKTAIQCFLQGGSIAAVDAATAISNATCQNARIGISGNSSDIDFDEKNLVQRSDGGCLYVFDGTASFSDGLISNNVLSAVGSGGGVFLGGKAVVTLVNTRIQSNKARQGGALSMSKSSKAIIANCSFVANVATAVAGAVCLKEDAGISISDTIFSNNVAARASSILSYSDGDVAVYTLTNVVVIADPGTISLMLGSMNFSNQDNHNVWNCSWPGTVFDQDFSKEFFSLFCRQCTEGTYAVDPASTLTLNRSCLPCPYGAKCMGSSATSNGLMTGVGFWGFKNEEDGTVTFHACPKGYCCLSGYCEYDHCSGGRTGWLCGECQQGQGLRFFSEACGNDNDCNDAGWASILIIVGASFEVLFLVVTTGNVATGIMSVMLYFYQVLPLVKSSQWKYASSTTITLFQSIFSVAPSSADDSSRGICLMASMTSAQKVGFKLVVQAVVLSVLMLFFVVHYLLLQKILKRFILRCRLFIKDASAAHYFAVAVRFVTIAYTTLVLTPLQMLQCVWIGNKQVWWFDANVECFQEWQIESVVAIVLLFPLPGLLICILAFKWKSEDDVRDSEWKHETWKVLTGPYKPSRRWWLGISLYRRMLLVAASTMILDANWKAMGVTMLCSVFAVFSVIMQPFRSSVTQTAENACLVILSILAATTAPQLSQLQFGTQELIQSEEDLEWIQFWLAVIPVAGYASLTSYRIFNAVRSKLLFKGTGQASRDDLETQMSCPWEEEEQLELDNQGKLKFASISSCPQCNAGTVCVVHQFC